MTTSRKRRGGEGVRRRDTDVDYTTGYVGETDTVERVYEHNVKNKSHS